MKAKNAGKTSGISNEETVLSKGEGFFFVITV
jgi:hypothetical protein